MTLAICRLEIARLTVKKRHKETLDKGSNRLLTTVMRAIMLKIETITFRLTQAAIILSLCIKAKLS